MSAGQSRYDEIEEGQALPELRVEMDRETYFAYNDLVKNINPLHSDPEYARRLGFKDIVVAGVYTFSFVTRMVEDWAGPAGRIAGVTIKYQNPIYIEETILHTGRVLKKITQGEEKGVECEVSVIDSGGDPLTSAIVRVTFD